MTLMLELNSNNLWLEISEEIQHQTWQESNTLATQGDRQRAYINLLCQKVVLPYLQEECSSVQVEKNQTEFWQLGVNGTAINIDNQCLIIIPSEAFDIDELRVPQELVDISELAADYYLAAQIDNEERVIRLWGYTIHKKLKEQGNYSRRDRSYFLERNDVTEDLNSLWLIREYFPDEPTRSSIESLPKLSLDKLNQLLETLANPEIIFPRRAVAFEEWGALLANENWRRILVERRTPQSHPKSASAILSQWLENKFEEGWQTINELVSPQLIGAFMSNQQKRAKLLDLGLELSKNKVALTIAVTKNEKTVSVQAGVYPTGEQTTLPPNLKLIILTETGEVFKEVASRSDDEFIRYNFEVEQGDKFNVKVALGEASITENFQV